MMGYLTKRGKTVPSWKRRFFKLKGATLFYYATPDDTLPLGSIILDQKYTVKLSKLRSNTVELSHPTERFEAIDDRTDFPRCYFLKADSGELMSSWLEALKYTGVTLDVDVVLAFVQRTSTESQVE